MTLGRRDRWHHSVRKLGGLDKWLQGSTALSLDMTRHEMHMVCIRVGSAEMERSGEDGCF